MRLIVVFHHVLADGMGGLAVLANLIDGVDSPPGTDFPAPKPPWHRLAGAGQGQASRPRAAHERPGPATGRPRRTSSGVNAAGAPLFAQPPCRDPASFGIVRVDLARVRSVGHDHGGTVNDVILAAVGGALSSLLAHRGEHVDHVVVSAPISGRTKPQPPSSGTRSGSSP